MPGRELRRIIVFAFGTFTRGLRARPSHTSKGICLRCVSLRCVSYLTTHTLPLMSSRSRRAGLLSVLILMLAFTAQTHAQEAKEPEMQPVDPAVMKAALPLVVEDFVLVRLRRNTTSHMGVEGEYFRVDKFMAQINGTLEGGPSDHPAFRIQIGLGPMSDRRAKGVRESGSPRVTVNGIPESVEVYDDTSRGRSAMIDTNAQKMMMVQDGASSARVAMMTSVSSALAGDAVSAATATADTGAVRRAQAVYNALPARAGQHELVEYNIERSQEVAESNQLAFFTVYAHPDQPRGTRISAGLVLPGNSRINRFIQQASSLGDDLRRDTTLAGRDAVVVGTGEIKDGVVTIGNDRALVLFSFDGYQIVVVARDQDVTEEDIIALASALDLSGLADE